MNIGRAIKLCRTQRGISQTMLAEQTKLSTSYLSMLENNKRDPTLSTLSRIAHVLHIPLGIIFFLGTENNDLGSINKKLQGDLARTALDLLNKQGMQAVETCRAVEGAANGCGKRTLQ